MADCNDQNYENVQIIMNNEHRNFIHGCIMQLYCKEGGVADYHAMGQQVLFNFTMQIIERFVSKELCKINQQILQRLTLVLESEMYKNFQAKQRGSSNESNFEVSQKASKILSSVKEAFRRVVLKKEHQ